MEEKENTEGIHRPWRNLCRELFEIGVYLGSMRAMPPKVIKFGGRNKLEFRWEERILGLLWRRLPLETLT